MNFNKKTLSFDIVALENSFLLRDLFNRLLLASRLEHRLVISWIMLT